MKLGTKIQLYTTVMTLIVVIIINLFVYYSYKQFSLNAEMGQLENRGFNIMQEIQNANDNDINAEAVLQAHLLSDGYMTVIDSENNPVVRIATEAEYANISMPYSTSQYAEAMNHEAHHFVMVSLPIIWENGEVYDLQIYENVQFLHETFEILRWILLLSTAIIFIVIFLLNRIITNFITRPINKLVDRMNRTETTSKYSMLEVDQKDTKELQELSAAFNNMMEELKIHDENQQAFIMNASHELKTPITVISSYSEMLKRFGKTREDVLDESIHAISDEARRMKYLTEQLLSFAKVNTGREEISRQPTRIVKLIRDIAARLETVYQREIDVRTDNESVLAHVDVNTFDQLLKIFMDNAYKYSSDAIAVEVQDHGQSVEVTIKDRGIGIPEEDIDHIFTRFYRVDKARARKTGGSGLGLSIARELAKLNGIDISVDSQVDVGTTFRLTMESGGNDEEEN
ncbi:HAMP domain-containing histidine kinase [Salinicoccus roseus]|uniref:sensor histidine kinase n=1 Tax=Salinicoccus roseus TaxID=45670 RepID=UPI001CA6F5CC|nr:HAMP domain-containing sensor histidine kinase [Salinicoccus roseus]MBY8910355.1 HAMP domain-containing histidine kinase [Salinicoccus roseus]